MERAQGVIGIATKYKVKKESLTSGRQSSHDYPFYVNHYSNHWPNTYKLTVTGLPNRTGLLFMLDGSGIRATAPGPFAFIAQPYAVAWVLAPQIGICQGGTVPGLFGWTDRIKCRQK